MELKKGVLYVISGPAGSGKTTLIKKLEKEFDTVKRSISFSTRKKRGKEEDKKDYFFIKEEEFKKKIEDNKFLEYAKVFGNFYGTSKEFVEKNLNEKKQIFLVIDVNGAEEIRKKKEAVFIFIKPPSIEVLRERLEKRKTDSEEEIKKRLYRAKKEMESAVKYDYLIVNLDIEKSYQILKSILIAEENKIKKGR